MSVRSKVRCKSAYEYMTVSTVVVASCLQCRPSPRKSEIKFIIVRPDDRLTLRQISDVEDSVIPHNEYYGNQH